MFFSLTEPLLPLRTKNSTGGSFGHKPPELDRNGPKGTEMDRIGQFVSSLRWGTGGSLQLVGKGAACKGKKSLGLAYIYGSLFGAHAICPKTITLQHVIFGQLAWWTFRYFYFFCSGEGESEAPGKGGWLVFIENLRRGVSQ